MNIYSIIGWADIGTGTKVRAVLIDTDEKKMLILFPDFVIEYTFENLQKNERKCVGTTLFPTVVFVMCPAHRRRDCPPSTSALPSPHTCTQAAVLICCVKRSFLKNCGHLPTSLVDGQLSPNPRRD
jgi:hypothetical protein